MRPQQEIAVYKPGSSFLADSKSAGALIDPGKTWPIFFVSQRSFLVLGEIQQHFGLFLEHTRAKHVGNTLTGLLYNYKETDNPK